MGPLTLYHPPRAHSPELGPSSTLGNPVAIRGCLEPISKMHCFPLPPYLRFSKWSSIPVNTVTTNIYSKPTDLKRHIRKPTTTHSPRWGILTALHPPTPHSLLTHYLPLVPTTAILLLSLPKRTSHLYSLGVRGEVEQSQLFLPAGFLTQPLRLSRCHRSWASSYS